MSQNFEIVPCRAVVEPTVVKSLQRREGIGSDLSSPGYRLHDIAAANNDLDSVSAEWVEFMREEQGFDDVEIAEAVLKCGGPHRCPIRCIPLVDTTFINGRAASTFLVSQVGVLAPWLVEFRDHWEPGGGDEGLAAACANWCRKHCEGTWVMTGNEADYELWEVYVSFASDVDAAAFRKVWQ
jgi:hypothetical protein